jgi:hypothetical protein
MRPVEIVPLLAQPNRHAVQCFPSSERGICRGHRVTAGVVEHPPCAAPSHAVIGARICQYAVQLALGGSVVAQSGRHSQVGQRRRSDALRRVDAGKLLQAPPELRRRIDDPGIEIIGAIKVVSTSKQLDCTQRQRIPRHCRAPPYRAWFSASASSRNAAIARFNLSANSPWV